MNMNALVEAGRLSGRRLKVAEARASIVDLADTWMREHALAGRSGLEAFCAVWPTLSVPNEVRERAGDSLSAATLYRWRSAREKGLAVLAPERTGRPPKITPDSRAHQLLFGILATRPNIRPTHAWRVLETLDPDVARDVSEDTVRRWMATQRRDNHQLWLRATNPDAAKSRLQPAFGRADEGIVRLNQLWELDSTPADVMLLDDAGRQIRCSVLGAIDVYSRRVKLLVSRTSKADAVCALLRRCLLDWGVPETVRTDNGKDYKSLQVQEVLRALGIEQQFCQPFASEQKPFIERFFRTFSQSLETLDGFLGHDVAERKALEALRSFAERLGEQGGAIEARLTMETAQLAFDRWAEHSYGRRVHRALARSPWDMVRTWSEPIRTIENERALDLLLVRSEVRSVQKTGIHHEKRVYMHVDLVPHIGSNVLVQPDPTDLGRLVVFSGNRDFICIAVDEETAGVDRQKLRALARVRARQVESETRQLVKTAKKGLAAEYAQQDLYAAKQARDLKLAQAVSALPPRGERYTTPALEAAAEAVRVNDALEVQPVPAPTPIRPQLRAVTEVDPDVELRERAWGEYLQLKGLNTARTPEQSRRLLQLEALPYIRGRAARLATG